MNQEYSECIVIAAMIITMVLYIATIAHYGSLDNLVPLHFTVLVMAIELVFGTIALAVWRKN